MYIKVGAHTVDLITKVAVFVVFQSTPLARLGLQLIPSRVAVCANPLMFDAMTLARGSLARSMAEGTVVSLPNGRHRAEVGW
jgi:hypothetical protein